MYISRGYGQVMVTLLVWSILIGFCVAVPQNCNSATCCAEMCNCSLNKFGQIRSMICATPDSLPAFPILPPQRRTEVRKIIVRNQPEISSLNSFDLEGYSSLQQLVIENCSLTNLTDRVLLLNLLHLAEVSFANNQIETFFWKSARCKSKKLVTLNLSGNPLSCSCDNLWLFDYDRLMSNAFDSHRLSEQVSEFSFNGTEFKFWRRKKVTPFLFNLPEHVISSNGSYDENTKVCKKLEHCETPIVNINLDRSPKVAVAGEALSLSCRIDSIGETRNHFKLADAVNLESLELDAITEQMLKIKRDVPEQKAAKRRSKVLNLTISKLSVFSSGFLLCIAENDQMFSVDIVPLMVLGPPEFYRTPYKPQKLNQTTVLVEAKVYGLPLPRLELIKENHGPVLINDKVQLTPWNTSLIYFYSLGANIHFKDYTTLCVKGRYLLRAINNVGEANTSFDILEGGCEHCPQDWSAPRPISACKMPNYGHGGPATKRNASTMINTVVSSDRMFVSLLTVGAILLLLCAVVCTSHVIWRRSPLRWKQSTSLTAGAAAVELDALQPRQRWEISSLNVAVQSCNHFYADVGKILKDERIAFYAENIVSTLKQLGEGAYGRVFLVEVHLPATLLEDALYLNAPMLMALKQLKVVTVEKITEFLNEARLLSELDHPNIVKFYGLSCRENNVALLLEYMENGDLVNFLRNHGPDNTQGVPVISNDEQLRIAWAVSQGLRYLSDRHLVHRDLAARNCLVGQGNCVKISDFGMARDTYVTDYYKMGNQTMVPLRWLPPECVLYRKFSTASDVWSFGVLLWEIFSYGLVPWFMYTNHEVLRFITEGKLLEQTSECPDALYQIMLNCWAKLPTDRISVDEIDQRLKWLMQNWDQQNSTISNSLIDFSSSEVYCAFSPTSSATSQNAECCPVASSIDNQHPNLIVQHT